MIDPMQQFKVVSLIPISVAGIDFSFTNSSLFMVVGTFFLIFLLELSTKKASLFPTFKQLCVEKIFFFFKNMTDGFIGDRTIDKSKNFSYFSIISTLFLLILTFNLLGLVPGAFTVTSQIVVTFTLSFSVFLLSIFVGFKEHGIHFFSFFCPKELPQVIKPFFVVIEVFSFCFRPVSLSIRLFANMVAGHVMIKIFTMFCTTLVAILPPLAFFPFLMNCVMLGFECLVALLQAYVFALLSCLYIKDTLYLH